MAKLQFRILYREFLFRVVDLELLSAQTDMSKLLGQFAALLVSMFLLLALSPSATWRMEHFMIATTMLVVGLFAVLSWDSTFPDRRDVLVLAPLPVRARTFFLAKVAAVATALGLAVVAVHAGAGLTWPFALIPAGGGVPGFVRSFMAYWITMFSAGAFIFASVLGVQGLAALLPRRYFLRLSAFLQMAAFCLFVSVYFLQPSLTTPEALTAPENQRSLAWLSSYWFLGLLQTLNGSPHPALAPLGRRAWIGLVIAVFGAGAAFLLSYFRTLRKIIEEPDIAPGIRGGGWLPRFGNSLETALVQFSIRTLLRSRQHRVMLAFYLGIGFAIVLLLMKAPVAEGRRLSEKFPLLFSSVVVMCFWVVGTRVVFSVPLDLRANWIFRITQIRGAHEYLVAVRRPLFVLAVAPVWAASAALFLWIWPWRLAAEHLVVLGLWGSILADVCLHGFQKIPFTCSYLPGKSYFHMAFFGGVGLLLLISEGVTYEQDALESPGSYVRMLAVLVVAAICARWRAVTLAKSDEAFVQFEDLPSPAIQRLELNRDGVIPITPAR